jgi:hypothetical protein
MSIKRVRNTFTVTLLKHFMKNELYISFQLNLYSKYVCAFL